MEWFISIAFVILLGALYCITSKYNKLHKMYTKIVYEKMEAEKEKFKMTRALGESYRVFYCISLYLDKVHKESPEDEKVNDLRQEIDDTQKMIMRVK